MQFCSAECARKGRALSLGPDWMIVHMRKMREAAASVHRQRAVDRALAVLPPDITPVEAYRLGLSRGRNMGYQSGLRLARKFEAELQRLQNGTV